ncbi:MAG: hypothetical protein V8Q85_01680 [Christensenellales bacterium]
MDLTMQMKSAELLMNFPQARYGKDSALRIRAAKGALRAEGEHSAA